MRQRVWVALLTMGLSLGLLGAPAPRASARVSDPAAPGPTKAFPSPGPLESYLADRPGTASVAMRKAGSNVIYVYSKGQSSFITASIVKLAVMATVMVQAEEDDRDLTEDEKSLLEPMITASDNDATTELWDDVGGPDAVRQVLRSMGADQTEPDEAWGMTTTTARDQVVIMSHFTMANPIIDADMRSYAISLLSQVEDDQDWGLTAAIPDSRQLVKNGWLPLDDGWHVNSVAARTGTGGYVVAGLTTSTEDDMAVQVETLEGLSRILATREYLAITTSSTGSGATTSTRSTATIGRHQAMSRCGAPSVVAVRTHLATAC